MRKKKDYREADKIREKLLEKGVIINDTKEGFNARLAEIL
jgi:cysteinyl-tRNA synthetase